MKNDLKTENEEMDGEVWEMCIGEDRVFDISQEKGVFSKIGMGLAMFSLISMLVSIIIQLVAMGINESLLNSSAFLNSASAISIYVFALPALLLVIGGIKAKAPKKREMSVGGWIAIFMIGMGLMYIGNFLGNTVMDMLSRIVGYNYSSILESAIDTDSIWISAVFLVVLAPIGEELIFRKLLIDRIGKYGCVISAVFSGLVFGLTHGNLYQFFYAFALGVLLGYVYYNTGNIAISISLHAAINFVGGVIAPLLSNEVVRLEEQLKFAELISPETISDVYAENFPLIIAMLLFLLFILASVVCAIVLPIVLRRKIILDKGELPVPAGSAVPLVISNSGVICMLVVYICILIFNTLPL